MATIKREPPVKRLHVDVGTKRYEVLVRRYDPTADIEVGSASADDGLWIVSRVAKTFRCACDAFLFRGKCSHVEAAKAADALLFAPDPYPGDADRAVWEKWLDEVAADGPPEDQGSWLLNLEDGPHLLDLRARR